MKFEKCIIGIDVGKEKNDYAVLADGKVVQSGKVENSSKGVKLIVKLCKKYGAAVAMEPTGAYEFLFRDALLLAGIECLRVDPYKVRKYAQARYNGTKNDKLDAKVIAEFASDNGGAPYKVPDPAQAKLRAYWVMCRKFRDLLVPFKQDMQWVPTKEGDKRLKKIKKSLQKQYDYFYGLCQETIKSDPVMSGLFARFTLVKGIGPKTAITVLAFLPEIGSITDAQVASLVGVAPIERSSGKCLNVRHIGRGRAMIRDVLYMAAMSAVRHNRILKAYYKMKRAQGHPGKWCIVPVMRKLIHLMNRIARKPDFVPQDDSVSFSRKKSAKKVAAAKTEKETSGAVSEGNGTEVRTVKTAGGTTVSEPVKSRPMPRADKAPERAAGDPGPLQDPGEKIKAQS